MASGRIVFGAIAVLLIASVSAMAQPAPDCRQAKTPAEKAICAAPELAEADAAMARAYQALRSLLPAEERAALLADQRRWVKLRDARCADKADKADRELAACLLAETEQRRRFFEGQGGDGAEAGGLRPAFFHEAKPKRYEIAISYPQFARPEGAAQSAFNRAARAIALDAKALSEIRRTGPPPVAGMLSQYQVDYAVPYLDQRLASVVFTTFNFAAGAAHPNSSRSALLFDLTEGRALRLADLLAEPKKAVGEISSVCRQQLEGQAKEEGWELFDNADFAAVVGEVTNWAAGKKGVEILFDPYSVAAYVVGARECRLSYAELQHWLKPGGPLPPRQQ